MSSVSDYINAKNVGKVVEKVSNLARQYYDDHDDYDGDSGGILGIFGMIVICGIFLLILLTVIPAILGLVLSVFNTGNGTTATIPLGTLNANAVTGRRKRAAGIGLPSAWNFDNVISSLEKAYKEYTKTK
ncbi:Uncharacterised protein g10392 [Pycnogonum litorale]